MKNLILLFVTIPFFSVAQNNHSRPVASLGRNESSAEVLLGTIAGPNTSKELVLLDPRLIAQNADCSVTSYTFSMTAGSRVWGPVNVTGSKLSDEIKEKIIDWDPNNVTVTFDNIHLRCNGQEMTAHPVVLRYDH